MPNLNQVQLCGNMTREPEIRYLPSGVPICTLGLAVTTKVKRGDEWVDDVLFVDVAAFGRQAEWAAEHIKGEAVLVDGRLKLESWNDKTTGQKRSKISVHANRVQFFTRAPNGAIASRGVVSDDDDIPF